MALVQSERTALDAPCTGLPRYRRLAWQRVAISTSLFLAFVGFYVSGLYRYLSFDYVQGHLDDLRRLVDRNLPVAAVAYVGLMVVLTVLSLPVCLLLSLLAGALFGFWLGTGVVSLGSTLGATGAFLTSRYLFRGFVERHWGHYLEPINRGMDTDGPYYLLTIRLVPIFFFFLVNVVVGLTRMRVRTFWIMSQLGMLPLTMVYVYTGTQITSWRSPRDVVSLNTLLVLTLVGLVPLVLRRVVRHFKSSPC